MLDNGEHEIHYWKQFLGFYSFTVAAKAFKITHEACAMGWVDDTVLEHQKQTPEPDYFLLRMVLRALNTQVGALATELRPQCSNLKLTVLAHLMQEIFKWAGTMFSFCSWYKV